MKKNIIISIVAVLIAIVLWRMPLHKRVPPEIPTVIYSGTEKVLDLSKLEPGMDRSYLLTQMVQNYSNNSKVFLLDDKDISTKIRVGAYKTQYRNGKKIPGGIVMLKRLPDGKDSIYWEITSPLFESEGLSKIWFVKDINNDGIKEIVTSWSNTIDLETRISYWIISVDPHTKTYKVLNVFVDKDKNIQRGLNFEHPDISKEFLNRFDTYGSASIGIGKILKDLDSDGLDEIIITNPSLERFGTVRWPDYVYNQKLTFDKLKTFTQTYKWNGKEYYLWKEEAQ